MGKCRESDALYHPGGNNSDFSSLILNETDIKGNLLYSSVSLMPEQPITGEYGVTMQPGRAIGRRSGDSARKPVVNRRKYIYSPVGI
jgi:hypothetical protein